MKKTLLIVILTLAMVLAFSGMALATVYVNGHQLANNQYYLNGDFTENAAEADKPTGDGNYFNFHLSGNKLILWDAVITEPYISGVDRYGIYSDSALEIVLMGDNVISLNTSTGALYGISCSNQSLTINGNYGSSLSLNLINGAESTDTFGIHTSSDTIQYTDLSINIDGKAKAYGLKSDGSITLGSDGNPLQAAINVKGGTEAYGVYTSGTDDKSIAINDSETAISIVAEAPVAMAFYTVSIDIDDATVEAVVMPGAAGIGYGLCAISGIDLDGAEVTALVKGAGVAVYATTYSIAIDDSHVIAAVNGDDSYAIKATANVNITGASQVEASMSGDISAALKDNTAAIYGNVVNISGSSQVTAVASGAGIDDTDHPASIVEGCLDANNGHLIDEKLGFRHGIIYFPVAIYAVADMNISGNATINATADSSGFTAAVTNDGNTNRRYTYYDAYYNYDANKYITDTDIAGRNYYNYLNQEHDVDDGTYTTTSDNLSPGDPNPDTYYYHYKDFNLPTTDNTFQYDHDATYYTGGAYAILSNGTLTISGGQINATVNLDKLEDARELAMSAEANATNHNHYHFYTTNEFDDGNNRTNEGNYDPYYTFKNTVYDYHYESGAVFAKTDLEIDGGVIEAVNTGIGGVAVGANGKVDLTNGAQITANAFGEGYRGQVYYGYEYDPAKTYATDPQTDVDDRDPLNQYSIGPVTAADIMPAGIRSVENNINIDGANVVATGAGPNYEYAFTGNRGWYYNNYTQAGYALWAYDGEGINGDNAIYILTAGTGTNVYATGLSKALRADHDDISIENGDLIYDADDPNNRFNDRLIIQRDGVGVGVTDDKFNTNSTDDSLHDVIIDVDDDPAVTLDNFTVSGYCVLNTYGSTANTLAPLNTNSINIETISTSPDDYLLVINSTPNGAGISCASLSITGDVDVTVANTRRDGDGIAIDVAGDITVSDAAAVRAISRGGEGLKATGNATFTDCNRISAISLEESAIASLQNLSITNSPTVNAVIMEGLDGTDEVRDNALFGATVNINNSTVKAITLGDDSAGIYAPLHNNEIGLNIDSSNVLALTQGETSIAMGSNFGINLDAYNVQALSLGLNNDDATGTPNAGAIIAGIYPGTISISGGLVDAVSMGDGGYAGAIINHNGGLDISDYARVHALAIGDNNRGVLSTGDVTITDSYLCTLLAGDSASEECAPLFSNKADVTIDGGTVRAIAANVIGGNNNGAYAIKASMDTTPELVNPGGDLTMTNAGTIWAYSLAKQTTTGATAAIAADGNVDVYGLSDIFALSNGGQAALVGQKRILVSNSSLIGVVNGTRAASNDLYAAIYSEGQISIANSGYAGGIAKGITTTNKTSGILAGGALAPAPAQAPGQILDITDSRVVAQTSGAQSMGIVALGDIVINNQQDDADIDVGVATWGAGSTGIFAAPGKITANFTDFDIRTYGAATADNIINTSSDGVSTFILLTYSPSNGMMSWMETTLNNCDLTIQTEGQGTTDHGACGIATLHGDIMTNTTILDIDTWGKFACGICAMHDDTYGAFNTEAGSVYMTACTDVDIHTRGKNSPGIHAKELARLGQRNNADAACIVTITTEDDDSQGIYGQGKPALGELGQQLPLDDTSPSVQIFESIVNISTGLMNIDPADLTNIRLPGIGSDGIEGTYYVEIDHSDINIITSGLLPDLLDLTGAHGIESKLGKIYIYDDSRLDIDASSSGIYADKNITVQNSSGDIKAGWNGVQSDKGDIKIKDESDLVILALSDGITATNASEVYPGGNVLIENSDVNIQAMMDGIYAMADVEIANSMANINALGNGIYVNGDADIIKGSEVDIDGLDPYELIAAYLEDYYKIMQLPTVLSEEEEAQLHEALEGKLYDMTLISAFLSRNLAVDVGINSKNDINVFDYSLLDIRAASAGLWASGQVNIENKEITDEEIGFTVNILVEGFESREGESKYLTEGHGIVAGDYKLSSETIDGVGNITIKNVRMKIDAYGKGMVNGWHWFSGDNSIDPRDNHVNDISITNGEVRIVSGSDGIQAMEGTVTVTETLLEVESFGPEDEYEGMDPDAVGYDENEIVRAIRARDGLKFNYNPLTWYMFEGTPKSAAHGISMFTVEAYEDEYITTETYVYCSKTNMLPLIVAGRHFPFQDVLLSDWFYQDVWNCWDVNLINGMTVNMYMPYDNLTYAQAIKLAACMNQWKADGAVSIEVRAGVDWYQPYVKYAELHEIIQPGQFAGQYNNKIDRYNFGMIFAKALPDAAYTPLNVISSIPDVPAGNEFYPYIFKLYQSGIVIGVDALGNFNGAAFINRAEVAAITNRMINPDSRKSITL